MSEQEIFSGIFKVLGSLDVSKDAKTLPRKDAQGKQLTYLSWSTATKILNTLYPGYHWRICEFTSEGIELPADEHGFQYQRVYETIPAIEKKVLSTANGDEVYSVPMLNPVTGEPIYMKKCIGFNVKTEIEIMGIKRSMWLYVMDSHMAACKDKPYEVKTRYNSYLVDAIDTSLINKAIHRCFVKNAAVFGLGLNLYNGDDLPCVDDNDVENMAHTFQPEKKQQAKANVATDAKSPVQGQKGIQPRNTANETVSKAPRMEKYVPTSRTNGSVPVKTEHSTKPVSKVNAAEPVQKIEEIEEKTMSIETALNVRFSGDHNFKYMIFGESGQGWDEKTIEKAKRRLVALSNNGDEIGIAAKTILVNLQNGTLHFRKKA